MQKFHSGFTISVSYVSINIVTNTAGRGVISRLRYNSISSAKVLDGYPIVKFCYKPHSKNYIIECVKPFPHVGGYIEGNPRWASVGFFVFGNFYDRRKNYWKNGYEIVGESFGDNVSGMTFNRQGLGELENAVDEGKIEVVLVKDLSRLGRHRSQTEKFKEILMGTNLNQTHTYKRNVHRNVNQSQERNIKNL